jgi:DNA-binding NarL/FixJ family response regulator
MKRRAYSPISVLVAGQERSGRAACLRILRPEKGIQVVGAARTGLEAIQAASQLKPRILLLHFDLLTDERTDLFWLLRQRSPRTKVLLITRRAVDKTILEVLSLGAKGYLKESALGAFLPKAVRKVEAGEAWIPRKFAKKIMLRLAGFADQGSKNNHIEGTR